MICLLAYELEILKIFGGAGVRNADFANASKCLIIEVGADVSIFYLMTGL